MVAVQPAKHNFKEAKAVQDKVGYRQMVLAFDLDELEERKKDWGLPADWRSRILK